MHEPPAVVAPTVNATTTVVSFQVASPQAIAAPLATVLSLASTLSALAIFITLAIV